MHHLHDRHRTGAERNRQDASDRQENHHDAKIKEKEGYPEDFPGEKFMTKKEDATASSFFVIRQLYYFNEAATDRASGIRCLICAIRLLSLGWVLRNSGTELPEEDIFVQNPTALSESYPAISINTRPI